MGLNTQLILLVPRGKVYGLDDQLTQMNVSIHEDNAGALLLASTLPPQFTPRSKWYHI